MKIAEHRPPERRLAERRLAERRPAERRPPERRLAERRHPAGRTAGFQPARATCRLEASVAAAWKAALRDTETL